MNIASYGLKARYWARIAAEKPKLVIRMAELEDARKNSALSRKVYGKGEVCTTEDVRGQINNFADGQLAACALLLPSARGRKPALCRNVRRGWQFAKCREYRHPLCRKRDPGAFGFPVRAGRRRS